MSPAMDRRILSIEALASVAYLAGPEQRAYSTSLRINDVRNQKNQSKVGAEQ